MHICQALICSQILSRIVHLKCMNYLRNSLPSDWRGSIFKACVNLVRNGQRQIMRPTCIISSEARQYIGRHIGMLSIAKYTTLDSGPKVPMFHISTTASSTSFWSRTQDLTSKKCSSRLCHVHKGLHYSTSFTLFEITLQDIECSPRNYQAFRSTVGALVQISKHAMFPAA